MIKTILSSIRKVVNKMYGYFIQKTLDTFSILVDSREQKNERAQLRYQQFGTTPYDRATLDIGDYTYDAILPSGKHIVDRERGAITPRCVIERKMNADELISNIIGRHNKDRFKRELERAKAANCKLHFIVEDATWADIFNGNYRSQIEPEVLLSYLTAYQAHYNMQINFISREHSGELIKALLYYDLCERLRNGEFDGK